MHTRFAMFLGVICIHSAGAEPASWRDELMYPVNPPRKVTSGAQSKNQTLHTSLPLGSPVSDATATTKYQDSRKAFSAGRALICNGQYLEALAMLEDASSGLSELRRNHPDFMPTVIWELAAVVSNEKRAILAMRKRAESEALKAGDEE